MFFRKLFRRRKILYISLLKIIYLDEIPGVGGRFARVDWVLASL